MNFLSNLSMEDSAGRIVLLVVVVSGLVQLSPIQINPWSWIAKKVGREMNGELIEKVDGLESKVTELSYAVGEQNAKNARAKILRFGDELMHGRRHSKDHFDEILLCITEYQQYCHDHPDFKNHMTETTTKYILTAYEHCMTEHSFL